MPEPTANIKADFWNDLGVKNETTTPPATATTTPAADPIVTPKADTVITPESKELSDTELLELLNKRNIKVASLEELKPKATDEEIKAAAEKRKNDVIAFGLKENKFKKEDYDNLIKAESDKEKFLFSSFAAELKQQNPNISDDEIQNEWSVFTLSNLEDGDFKKNQRKKELNELAELKLKNQFSSIYNVEKEYSAYEQNQNQNAAFTQKVQAAFPVYQKDVQSVIEKLKSQKVTIEDTQNPANNVDVEITYNDADLKELQDAFLDKTEIIKRIKNGYTVEAMIEDADMFLWKKHKGRHLSKAAKDYNSIQQDKYLAGRHGIVPKKELVIADNGGADTVTTKFWADVLPTEAPAKQ